MINRTPKGVLNEVECDKLVVSNLHLVNIVAKKYKFIDCDKYEDLIQEGRLGLIKAAQSFNLENKLKFKSYAIYHIRYSIQDFLRKESTLVHIPYNRLCKAYRLLRYINNSTNNSSPLSLPEMRGFLNCDIEYLDDILFIIDIIKNKLKKLEETQIVKKNEICYKHTLSNIYSIVNLLSEKEKFIINQKYVENKSFREISKEILISHETVRKIHNESIAKIKNHLVF